jgi:hypothetical protein
MGNLLIHKTAMNKNTHTAISIGFCCISLGMSSISLAGGLKQKVTGTWSMVSQTIEEIDGTPKPNRFGDTPKGIAIFEQNGRYAIILLRSDLPKIASGNALTGTPEEDQAIVHGSTAYFGTWSVDDATSTMVTHVDAATYPNWDGLDQKRQVSITGDKMRLCVSSQIGGVSCVVWRKDR